MRTLHRVSTTEHDLDALGVDALDDDLDSAADLDSVADVDVADAEPDALEQGDDGADTVDEPGIDASVAEATDDADGSGELARSDR